MIYRWKRCEAGEMFAEFHHKIIVGESRSLQWGDCLTKVEGAAAVMRETYYDGLTCSWVSLVCEIMQCECIIA
jgi:hypothetical protein